MLFTGQQRQLQLLLLLPRKYTPVVYSRDATSFLYGLRRILHVLPDVHANFYIELHTFCSSVIKLRLVIHTDKRIFCSYSG